MTHGSVLYLACLLGDAICHVMVAEGTRLGPESDSASCMNRGKLPVSKMGTIVVPPPRYTLEPQMLCDNCIRLLHPM